MKKILIIISCAAVISGGFLSYAASNFGVIRNTFETTTVTQSTTERVTESSTTVKNNKEETTTAKAKPTHGKKETSTTSSTTSTTKKESTSSKEKSSEKTSSKKKKQKKKKKAATTAASTTKRKVTTTTTKAHIDVSNTISINISVIDSKNPYILNHYKYEYEDGDTVYDILKRACDKNGIPIGVKSTSFGLYVYSINGIDEDYFGEKKGGWTYTVNGKMPYYSVDKYSVSKDDVIVFNYVKVN